VAVSELRTEKGFTLVELLVSMLCTLIVVGGSVAMTAQVQNGYRRQSEDSVGEQEARYALELIGRHIRGAGFNPFNSASSGCPTAGTVFAGVVADPNGDDVNDDVTLQMDTNPPDGLIGGPAGLCNQANEHVTISLDAENDTIVFLDEAVGAAATTRTDRVIENLTFVFKDENRVALAAPVNSDNIVYIETQITIRTRTVDAATGLPATRTLTSEVRVRGRS
jgi:type II secretory pathway pseudopilin PulG